MYPPTPHDLTAYDDQFEFEKNGFCPHQWEISVPQKNCIIWGVVLSYLKSADFTEPGKFEERLNRLTENEFDPDTVKSTISNFNPFFNIHKIFFDETLQKVNQTFRKVLNENRPSSAPKTVSYDLQLISTLLKSNILIVDLSNKNLHLVTPSNGCSVDLAAITMICREYSNTNGKQPVLMKRFTFALNKDLCWELRTNAFRIILESSEIRDIAEKEIQQLNGRKEKKVNILIALLKKNLTHVISDLYDSSYIVAKLGDAGFLTDPRLLDGEGFSAFYHALLSKENNILYILHRYAATNCYDFVTTFRDPNPSIIPNLSKLQEILEEDCNKSNKFEAFGEKAESARISYQDLLRFNEFLILVSQGMNDIRVKPDSSPLEAAIKLRELILFILDTYDAFFSVGQSESQQILEKELIENYSKHKTYYDNLDHTVTLLFFDNIFFLKRVWTSPRKGIYSELQLSFILSAVTNKYFTDDAKEWVKMLDLGLEWDSKNLSIILFLERLNLRAKVKNFCSILREMKLVEEDLVQCMPKHEITDSVCFFQELKDEVLVSRLDHYMRTASETIPKGMTQKFVIQRTLQVIGESINVEEAGPSSIRHLLRKSLPEDTINALKKVQNILSHLKSFQFPLKFETEEDDSLFTSMQSEILNINESFQNLFFIQRVQFIEFLINRGQELSQKFLEKEGIHMHPVVKCLKDFGGKLRKRTMELKCLSEQKVIDRNLVNVPNIKEFCQILVGCASENFKKKIHNEIPLQVRTRLATIKKLEQDLEKGIAVDIDRFDHLFLKSKDLSSIKKDYEKYLRDEFEEEPVQTSKKSSLLHKIKNAPNPLYTLDLIFEKKKVSDSQHVALYEAIPFSEGAKRTLNLLIEISKSPLGNNLGNLLNRIKHLYRISIDEQYDIRFMWERAKSSKAKQHIVYKIVKRYFQEISFQVSMELLLFDCFAILENNEAFRYFWEKDSFLFNGIDLRNVMTFGDPHLMHIGHILDPTDLPSELVQKMLQLCEDIECIETLCDLYQKVKGSDKNSDNSSEWYKLKERIICCPRWQEYSKLLVEGPKDSETWESMVSFLKNVTEPKRKKKY